MLAGLDNLTATAPGGLRLPAGCRVKRGRRAVACRSSYQNQTVSSDATLRHQQ